MPQMTPKQARVTDPVLSTVARGYVSPDNVGMALFPYVRVMQRGGKIIQFGKEHFRLYNTARAPGANIVRLPSSYSGLPYALESHAIEEGVPVEMSEEAEVVPGIDLGRGAVRRTQNVIALALEYRQAALATTAANYAATNKVTLAGTSQWSDPGSDPIADAETAKEAVRTQIGKRPNTCIMSASVFAKAKTHSKITDRIKYTGRDIATPDLIASLFGIDRLLVGDAVYLNDAGVMTDVWGKFVVFAYTDLSDVNEATTPSYGYTYRLNNYPNVKEAYFDPKTNSWVYPVFDEVAPVIAGAEAGYLISAAVA